MAFLEAEQRARAILGMSVDEERTVEAVRRALRRRIGRGSLRHPDQAAVSPEESQAFMEAGAAVELLSKLYERMREAREAREARKAAEAKTATSTSKPNAKKKRAAWSPAPQPAPAPRPARPPPPPPPPVIPPGIDADTRRFLQQFMATGQAVVEAGVVPPMDAPTRDALERARAAQPPPPPPAPTAAPEPTFPVSLDADTRRFLQAFIAQKDAP